MSQTAASSTPGTDRAYRVSPIPMPPNPMVAMRIRSLGEVCCARASEAARAADPASTCLRVIMTVLILCRFLLLAVGKLVRHPPLLLLTDLILHAAQVSLQLAGAGRFAIKVVLQLVCFGGEFVPLPPDSRVLGGGLARRKFAQEGSHLTHLLAIRLVED